MPTPNTGPAYFHSRRLSFAIATVLLATSAHAQERPSATADELQAVIVTGTRTNYDARKTHDFAVAYDCRVYVGVNNLTDQKPDLSTFYPVSSVGRFFFAGAVVSLGH